MKTRTFMNPTITFLAALIALASAAARPARADLPSGSVQERFYLDSLARDRHGAARRTVERSQQVKKRTLPGSTRPDDGHHFATSYTQVHAVEHWNQPAVASRVCLRQVYCFQHRHSCRMASTGNNLAAWRDGYSVASAAISKLASTIIATSKACVATGR